MRSRVVAGGERIVKPSKALVGQANLLGLQYGRGDRGDQPG